MQPDLNECSICGLGSALTIGLTVLVLAGTAMAIVYQASAPLVWLISQSVV